MITIDMLGVPEQTISVPYTDIVELKNVMSFQNLSRGKLQWSTGVFTEANQGAVADPGDERLFSVVQTIYIRNNDRKSIARMQVRSISL